MKTPGQILAIPGTKWFDDLPFNRKAPVLYWVTFAIVVAFLCLPAWNLDMWAAWIGWFAVPFLAEVYAFWNWKRGLRLARKKKSRELMRAAQERFGLTKGGRRIRDRRRQGCEVAGQGIKPAQIRQPGSVAARP